jgi:hypothetical protein
MHPSSVILSEAGAYVAAQSKDFALLVVTMPLQGVLSNIFVAMPPLLIRVIRTDSRWMLSSPFIPAFKKIFLATIKE